MSHVRVGRVVFFNNVKGWGLITAKIEEKDELFFAHWRNIACPTFRREKKPDKFRTLVTDSLVTFIPSSTNRGNKFRDALAIFTQSTTNLAEATRTLEQVNSPQEDNIVYGCN